MRHYGIKSRTHNCLIVYYDGNKGNPLFLRCWLDKSHSKSYLKRILKERTKKNDVRYRIFDAHLEFAITDQVTKDLSKLRFYQVQETKNAINYSIRGIIVSNETGIL